LKLFDKSEEFRPVASMFKRKPSEVNKTEIIHCDESALLCLYNDDKKEGLDHLCVSKYTEKVAKSSNIVNPKVLPPISAAAIYHSLRVYFQIPEWKENVESLDPTKWGWELVNDTLKPLTSNIAPGPENLMKIIRCSCKTGYTSCPCKKVGFECSQVCKIFKGVSCKNSVGPKINKE
jgi:hypothetical protein